ncbi:hypothetical protein [Micromonospora sp. NPDC049679]|uniref:hypothetical protein n=1 Tax=Micromonospora sp. NPDC049679 TaxID=3155920 RepID=UPI0033EAC944
MSERDREEPPQRGTNPRGGVYPARAEDEPTVIPHADQSEGRTTFEGKPSKERPAPAIPDRPMRPQA